MSRTGVGIRVLLDGEQLDDGCINWATVQGSYGPPWTETRRNLNPNPNGSGVNGWFSNDAAKYPVSNDPTVTRRPGAVSKKATRTTVAPTRIISSGYATGANGWTNATRAAVVPGQAYVASVYYRTNMSDLPTPRLALYWFDSGGVQIGAAIWTGVETSVPRNTWARTMNASVAPAGAVSLGLSFEIYYPLGYVANGTEIVWIQDAQIEAGTVPTEYFDGAMTATTTAKRNSWAGAANASASIQETGTLIDPYPGYVDPGVFADDGLSVVWGRSTTVDQPEPSTCTFKVSDAPGGVTVLDTLKLGGRVDVFADAILSGGPIESNAFKDPSFDVELRATASAATAVRTQSRAESAGGWSAQITPTSPTTTAKVVLPPGPLQASGTNPLAWIDLQSTKGGETWTVRARFWAAAGVTVRLRPVAYSGPYASVAEVLPYPAEIVGNGGWQTVETTFAPGLSAAWIGLQLETFGGIRWQDMPDPETWATITTTGTTWRDLSDVWIDHVDVLGPGGASAQSVLVFSGRITDLQGQYDPDWDQPSTTVTATDFLGDLGNRYIGAEPFPLESVTNRVTRILGLAARPGEPAIQIEIAATLGPVPLSWDDVDHAAAAGLLTEVAESVDGVLWSATHPVIGPYIKLEDPAARMALYELGLVGGKISIVPVDFAGDPDAPPSISACDVLRDPVTFELSVSDLATRVAVTWLRQIAGPPISTEENRVETINAPAEIDAGTRAVNASTLLTTSVDAQRVADQLLARLGAAWRISGLAVADADLDVPDAEAARMLLMLLNGVTRGGQPLILSELPAWSPTGETAPIYLEGGTYSFIGGGWDLDLTVSRAAGQGRNATWDEIPNTTDWQWDDWSPDITWDDLRGVAGP